MIFWFFHKNQNNSLQKPLFLNFGQTYTDVFFDDESESDVIFLKKWPPGVKGGETYFHVFRNRQKRETTPCGSLYFLLKLAVSRFIFKLIEVNVVARHFKMTILTISRRFFEKTQGSPLVPKKSVQKIGKIFS